MELTARINALIRRAAPPSLRRTIEYSGFAEPGIVQVQLPRHAHFADLARIQHGLAVLFLPGVYISRETIGTVIWRADSEVAGRTIEQHVYKLRKKLQVDGKPVVMIRTAYSQGYRLELCEDAGDAPLEAQA